MLPPPPVHPPRTAHDLSKRPASYIRVLPNSQGVAVRHDATYAPSHMRTSALLILTSLPAP
jgi:hypothetical protein